MFPNHQHKEKVPAKSRKNSPILFPLLSIGSVCWKKHFDFKNTLCFHYNFKSTMILMKKHLLHGSLVLFLTGEGYYWPHQTLQSDWYSTSSVDEDVFLTLFYLIHMGRA